MPSNSLVRYGSLQQALYIGVDDSMAIPLVQFVILYEDLRIESEIIVGPQNEKSSIPNYLSFYALRRMYVTLKEFQDALGQLELSQRFADIFASWDGETQQRWKDLRAQLRTAKIQEIRNNTGGHILASGVREALKKPKLWEGPAKIEYSEQHGIVAHIAFTCVGAIYIDNTPDSDSVAMLEAMMRALGEWKRAYEAAKELAQIVLAGIIWPRLK